MNMENKIIEIVVYCVIGVLTAIVSVLIGVIKKKVSENLNILSENLIISEQITPYVSAILHFAQEAEKHKNYSSDEKLEYVLSRMIKYAVDNNVNIKDSNSLISDINTLIDFSNNVNTKKLNVVEK